MGTLSSCCASNEGTTNEGLAAAGVDHMAELPMEQDQTIQAAMDPSVFDDSSKKDEGTGAPKTVEVLVRKSGPDDKLGMDVKHVRGRLVVVQVFHGGAVDRANQNSRSRSPPGEVIEVGDVIAQVNDVKDIDTAMVAECQQKSQLRIRALRR
mmetsp:Transcript_62149/g.140028  ORF Transcript_62149/g.140028 Transcript_62149/m.140028 type:complete len:152 (+) Transcript_62149:62-517(+)